MAHSLLDLVPYLKSIPETDVRKLLIPLFTTIKANIGFDKLQAMREASPTGGALGQVSNQELSSLQAVFGNLDQSQSEEDLKYNLKMLQRLTITSFMERVIESFQTSDG